MSVPRAVFGVVMTTAPPNAGSLAAFVRDYTEALAGAELRRRFGASALKRAVARGDLVRVLPDVYAPRHHGNSFQVRAKAATDWSGGAVSGVAALFVWGLIDDPPDVVEVVVPRSKSLRPQPGVILRRPDAHIPRTVRQRLTVVSPAAAVVLGYGRLPKSMRSEVLYSAVRRRIASPQQLASILAAVPRVKARRSLERSVRAAAAGAQSYLEERALYRVFNTEAFAHFVRQHEVVIEGNQFFLDMFDPRTKVALELDGRRGHLDEFRQRNIARDAWLATIGIQTIRFSYKDLVERPDWCRRVVLEVLRVRAAQLG